MRTRFLITIFVCWTLYLVFSVSEASACLCDELTIEQKINQADVIFSGTMDGNTWNHWDKNIASGFDVQTIWKGADSFPLIENGYATVITPKDSTACGVNFIAGKEYLIYARADGDNLYTTTCDGSWFLDGRGGDISALDEIGSTHQFIDARDARGFSSSDCTGPGLYSKEQCEFDNLIRQVVLPLVVAGPIVGISSFFIWRKRN